MHIVYKILVDIMSIMCYFDARIAENGLLCVSLYQTARNIQKDKENCEFFSGYFTGNEK
jgi:hypothetical protein